MGLPVRQIARSSGRQTPHLNSEMVDLLKPILSCPMVWNISIIESIGGRKVVQAPCAKARYIFALFVVDIPGGPVSIRSIPFHSYTHHPSQLHSYDGLIFSPLGKSSYGSNELLKHRRVLFHSPYLRRAVRERLLERAGQLADMRR